MQKTLSILTKTTTATLRNWQKEQRKIIDFLYKYFNKNEIEEFLKTGAIYKQDLILDLNNIEIKDMIKKTTFLKLANFNEKMKRALKVTILFMKKNDIKILEAINQLSEKVNTFKAFKKILIDNENDFLLKKDFLELKKLIKKLNKNDIKIINENKDEILNFITKNLKNQIIL